MCKGQFRQLGCTRYLLDSLAKCGIMLVCTTPLLKPRSIRLNGDAVHLLHRELQRLSPSASSCIPMASPAPEMQSQPNSRAVQHARLPGLPVKISPSRQAAGCAQRPGQALHNGQSHAAGCAQRPVWAVKIGWGWTDSRGLGRHGIGCVA